MSVAWAQKSLLVLVSIPIQDQEQCQRAWLEDLWFYGFFKECINEVDSADCLQKFYMFLPKNGFLMKASFRLSKSLIQFRVEVTLVYISSEISLSLSCIC